MNRSTLFNNLRYALGILLLGAVAELGAAPALAADASAAAPNQLQSIDVQTLQGKQVQLTLHLSGPAPEPLAFTIDKPARISLDLPNTGLALSSRRIDVRQGGIDTVLAAEADGRSRIVLNLDQLQPYTTRVQGNDVIVTVGAAAPSGGTAVAASSAAAAPMSGRSIRSIDFRRGEGGIGRLIVKLSDPRTPVSLKQQGNQILIDFSGTDLPKSLQRRYDTADFATPVSGFDVDHTGNDTHIVMTGTGEFEQLAYQTDDQYVVEVQLPKAKAAAATDVKEYHGEKLSLNFQDIEVRSVLQLLADASGQNMVVSDSVTGNLTLRLQSVPWDQALDIVLRLKGLDKRQQGNVLIIGPTEELASREKAELASRRDVQALSPIHTEYLQINYAKASDIAGLLKASAGNSVLSERGSVAVDSRTNMLLISDTADRITDVRKLVASLDIPVRQVLIETRIVIVNDDFTRQLGAVLGVTGTSSVGNNGLFETTGTAAGTDQGLSSALSNLATTGSVYPVTVPTGGTAANRYNVNLPVSSPAGSIAFMLLGNSNIVDLELSAAQAESRGEIVSSPRVITANQQEATIKQGVEIPYQQSASSGATTISFKDAVLLLKVKPLITPDNRIILDLDISDDAVGSVVVASGGVNVPAIDTRAIKTQVLVGDGQTVVLGGILSTTHTDDETKVPWLGDIPILGNLFKTTTKTNNKDELLIFVTPKIIREGVSVN
jgi:type IV pilus assembly protein PilQ